MEIMSLPQGAVWSGQEFIYIKNSIWHIGSTRHMFTTEMMLLFVFLSFNQRVVHNIVIFVMLGILFECMKSYIKI